MVEPKIFSEEHNEWKEMLINYEEARNLFPHGGDEVTRRTKQFTLTEEVCDAWEDFMQTYSGTMPQKGRGISSALTEIAQRLLMGVVAAFDIEDIAEKLRRIMPSDYAIERVQENLIKLAKTLDK